MDKVVFILGPTGVGKSDFAIRLANDFDGEIISSDSVQIFKGFDIGSAKITKAEMKGVVHHAIDICEPEDYFTVYDFVEFTRKKISEINSKNKLAIVVGGTGLYIKALVDGYNFGASNKHDEFREKMKQLSAKEGSGKLWEMLNKKNSTMANKISENDEKRLIRALEVCEFGEEQTKSQANFDYLLFALTLDREKLYDRINRRVDKMLEKGLIKEVEGLLKQGISRDCQPMKAIGYKEIGDFLDGKLDKQSAIDLVKQHSRNYAKRQMTFLRGMSNILFVDVDDKERAYQEIKSKVSSF